MTAVAGPDKVTLIKCFSFLLTTVHPAAFAWSRIGCMNAVAIRWFRRTVFVT
jgi:hypothetical protein